MAPRVAPNQLPLFPREALAPPHTLAAHAAAVDHAVQCEGCDRRKVRPPAVGTGLRGRVAFLLETPPEDLHRTGDLWGSSLGDPMRRVLGALDLLPEHALILYVLACHAPRPPRGTEIATCRPHWEPVLDAVAPKALVAMGSAAVSALDPKLPFQRARQFPQRRGALPWRGTYGPQALLLPTQDAAVYWELISEDLSEVRKVLGGV